MSLSDREAGDIIRRIINLEEGVKDLRSEVKSMDGKVDGILSRFDRVDGGLKVAMAVSGFLGALSMLLLTKVLPMLFAGLPRL